jgi:hypothetical protein
MNAPAHDDNHNSTFPSILIGAAGFWAIVFTIITFLALNRWFVPSGQSLEMVVMSTSRIMGMVAIIALVHVYIQLWLTSARAKAGHLHWGVKVFDYVTSLLPILGILFGHIWAANIVDQAYAQWWFEMRCWIDAIVILAIFVDIGSMYAALSGKKDDH